MQIYFQSSLIFIKTKIYIKPKIESYITEERSQKLSTRVWGPVEIAVDITSF